MSDAGVLDGDPQPGTVGSRGQRVGIAARPAGTVEEAPGEELPRLGTQRMQRPTGDVDGTHPIALVDHRADPKLVTQVGQQRMTEPEATL